MGKANPRFGHDGAATTLSTGRWESAFRRLTGDLDSLSAKRQRALPACCKVYDLVSFATEMATHHADAAASRLLRDGRHAVLAGPPLTARNRITRGE